MGLFIFRISKSKFIFNSDIVIKMNTYHFFVAKFLLILYNMGKREGLCYEKYE